MILVHIFHTSNKELGNFGKNFGELLIRGKYLKNVINNDFNKKYDYPLSIEGINKFDKDLKKLKGLDSKKYSLKRT